MFREPGAKNVGLCGHDFTAAKQLMLALETVHEDQVDADDSVVSLVSGDLTQTGTGCESSVVYTDLGSMVIEGGHGAWLGLQVDHWLEVRGNPDHWTGLGPSLSSTLTRKAPIGFPPNVFPRFHEPTPWQRLIFTKDDSFKLDLLGVDSNKGMMGQRNLKAMGKRSVEDL